LLCACPDGGGGPTDAVDVPPDSGPDIETAWIEIGTGARDFQPLVEGQEIPIILGIQNGWHIWGGLRGGGFDGDNVIIEFRLVQDGQVIGGAGYIDDLTIIDDHFEYAGVAAILVNDNPDEVSGHPLVLALRLTTNAGDELFDSIEVLPRCCE
jgi:hypothetical protein